MINRVELAEARVEWAFQYVEVFNKQRRQFIASHENLTTMEDEIVDGQEFTLFKINPMEPISSDLMFLFGDAIHNLRAACDNLVQGIARDFGVSGNTSMPICLDETGPEWCFEKWVTQNPGLPKPIFDALKAVQPFNTYTFNQAKLTGRRHPLRMLHDLWNHDKHESPIEASLSNVALRSSKSLEKIGAAELKFERSLEKGSVVFRIPKKDGNDIPIIDVAIDVTLKQGGAGDGKGAAELLKDLHDYVRDEVIRGVRLAIS